MEEASTDMEQMHEQARKETRVVKPDIAPPLIEVVTKPKLVNISEMMKSGERH